MSEITKTLAFVTVSATLAGVAAFSHFSGQPTPTGDFERVGTPFYEDFDSSSKATALEVVAVDPDTMNLQRFSVRNVKGTWKIPSHHNYPAEAADRLAQTSTSVIGIIRESYAGGKSDHERLGVIDPLESGIADVDDVSGIGKRLTLLDASGDALVDFIIGQRADDDTNPNHDLASATDGSRVYRYLRRADEQQVYKAIIDVDLSTRFADWIDPDLLRLDPSHISRIEIDNYELTEERGGLLGQVKQLYKTQGDHVVLNRASFTDPWILDDLNPESEELDTGKIHSSLEILGSLSIVGVRPKFKFNGQPLLTADLKFNRIPELESNPQEAQAAVDELQDELEDRGFSLAGSQQKLEVASAHGQFQAGTGDGVLYTLQVGKTVEGSEKEIEVGGAKSLPDEDTEEAKEKIANYQEGEKNRYVMIRVSFDESLLGPKPQLPSPPIEPVRPDGYEPAKEPSSDSAEADKTTESDSANSANTANEQDSDSVPPADATEPDRPAEFITYEGALAEFERDKIDYELAKSRFEDEIKLFQKRVEEGQKLVDELNQRFGDWYYVIKGSNLRALQMERKDIIRPAQHVPETPEPTAIPERPNLDFPDVEAETAQPFRRNGTV